MNNLAKKLIFVFGFRNCSLTASLLKSSVLCKGTGLFCF